MKMHSYKTPCDWGTSVRIQKPSHFYFNRDKIRGENYHIIPSVLPSVAAVSLMSVIKQTPDRDFIHWNYYFSLLNIFYSQMLFSLLSSIVILVNYHLENYEFIVALFSNIKLKIDLILYLRIFYWDYVSTCCFLHLKNLQYVSFSLVSSRVCVPSAEVEE